MEEQKDFEQELPVEEKDVYVPRPAWQVWGARIGVVIMILAFLGYCWQMATVGS